MSACYSNKHRNSKKKLRDFIDLRIPPHSRVAYKDVLAKAIPLKTVRPDNAKRDAKIHARREDGLTFRAIGREFKLTGETVRLIVGRLERVASWHAMDVAARHGNVVRGRLRRRTTGL